MTRDSVDRSVAIEWNIPHRGYRVTCYLSIL